MEKREEKNLNLPDGIFERFLCGFKEYEKKIKIKKLRDDFLDSYSVWLKSNNRKNKLRVLQIALKLSSMDKDFKISSLFKTAQ